MYQSGLVLILGCHKEGSVSVCAIYWLFSKTKKYQTKAGRKRGSFTSFTAGYPIFSYIKAHTFFPKEMEIKTTKEV